MKKKVHHSLSMQSAACLGILIILKAVLPVYTGYEIPDELFVSICSLLGVSLTYGIRRALPVVILCMLPFSSINCGPVLCSKASIVIGKHPELPKPAGKITVKCDGKDKAIIVSKEVLK